MPRRSESLGSARPSPPDRAGPPLLRGSNGCRRLAREGPDADRSAPGPLHRIARPARTIRLAAERIRGYVPSSTASLPGNRTTDIVGCDDEPRRLVLMSAHLDHRSAAGARSSLRAACRSMRSRRCMMRCHDLVGGGHDRFGMDCPRREGIVPVLHRQDDAVLRHRWTRKLRRQLAPRIGRWYRPCTRSGGPSKRRLGRVPVAVRLLCSCIGAVKFRRAPIRSTMPCGPSRLRKRNAALHRLAR